MSRHQFLALCLSLLLLLATPGAILAQDAPAAPASPPSSKSLATATGGVPLFKAPLTPEVYEVPAEALATWRRFADEKPALLLLANHPFLQPLDDGQLKTVPPLVHGASGEELRQRSRLSDPDPAFVSLQAVSAAIASGLIAELVYVMPKGAPLTFEAFRERAYLAGFLTEAEALALTVSPAGTITGTARGLPFRCVRAEALPKIAGPVLVHIDLGFFLEGFVNEIKTPSYPKLFETATALRDAAYPAIRAITLSFSNQEAGFSLDSRFVINSLVVLLQNPSILDGEVPTGWMLRADAMYAGNLFADDVSEDFINRAILINPIDPDAHFAQALLLFKQQRNTEGYAALDRAIALDPGYAKAYLELAEAAKGAGGFERALQHLDRAARHFPDNAFLRLERAEALLRLGRVNEAIPLLADLQKLPWSPVYHADVPARLDHLANIAREQAAKGNPP